LRTRNPSTTIRQDPTGSPELNGVRLAVDEANAAAGGPIVGAAFFLLLREGLSRFLSEYYLIPLGIIFIAIVLGFARRWLNH